jgi:hypothetical protein
MTLLALAATFALGSLPAAAKGNKHLRADLSGYNEVPPISTAANGEFRATINRDETEIEYELSYDDMSSAVLFAHIHFGTTGVNGGVATFLCGGGGKPACPASGSVSGTIVAADIIGPGGQGIAAGEFSELVAAIREGAAYANAHTTNFPGGEIRGQID